jgi:hypothetical protein
MSVTKGGIMDNTIEVMEAFKKAFQTELDGLREHTYRVEVKLVGLIDLEIQKIKKETDDMLIDMEKEYRKTGEAIDSIPYPTEASIMDSVRSLKEMSDRLSADLNEPLFLKK